jgi:predicted component of viral defense system (DUF524 family)
MTELNRLKERIEKLNKFHQVEILKLLKTDDTCTLNENKNGIFINLTSLNNKIIYEIEKYLEYVQKQETQLSETETQKSILTNTFFKDNKDNKDNTSITLNAEL